jgi:hypothetical protein
VKRIEIFYGGEIYTVGATDYDELRGRITGAVLAGHGWLRVNHGSGSAATADLLVTPGVPIAILATESTRTPDHEPPADG